MRTVPFQSILNWLARRMLGSEANLTNEFAAAYVDMINTAVRECWERDFWPEWTTTEQRQYRPAFPNPIESLILQGTEYLYAGAYYRALHNTNNNPTDSPSNWEQCGVNGAAIIDAVLPLDQDEQTPIGTPQSLHRRDPRIFAVPCEVRFALSPRGLEVSAPALELAQPWLTFRQRPPVFTATAWVNSAAAGQTFYYAPAGECYLALADNTAVPGSEDAKWQLIPMPYVLAEAVKRFAYADALRDDGQNDKASMEEDFAEDDLATEWTKQEAQCGLYRTFAVHTR